MKKIVFFAISVLIVMSGCSTKVTTKDLKIDGTKIDFSKIDSYKTGTSCITFLQGGSTSIADAAKAGGIKTILYVETINDTEAKTTCTKVYGE